MNRFGKIFRNSNGITLIELLIAMVITTMVIGIAYGVMITGNKTYQKIAIEGAIRDEADFVIARIMQLFYESEISDIKNCTSSSNTCIEIHNTETSKISSGENNERVSITSIDELKGTGSTITQVKIDDNGNLIFEEYGTTTDENKQIVIDLTNRLNSEIVNSEKFEFVTKSSGKNSKIKATCSYSTAIVTDPSSGKKFIKNKCNNGIAEISLIIQNKNETDEALQLELNSQFGF